MGLGHLGPLKGDTKVKKKTLIIVILVVAIAAIAAAGAYAVWSNQKVVPDNTISTGGVTIAASDTAMHFDGLLPGSSAPPQFVWVRNDSKVPIMMYAYVRVQDGWDPALTNYVHADITLAPHDFPTDATTLGNSLGYTPGTPYTVYQGVVASLLGADNGRLHLKTIDPNNVATPMDPGQYALYKVVLSLDPNTPQTPFENTMIKCDMVFVGGQVNGLSLAF